MNQPTDLDLDALARREARVVFDYDAVKDDDAAYGLTAPAPAPYILLTTAERDALVTMARAYRTLMRRMHLLEDDPK